MMSPGETVRNRDFTTPGKESSLAFRKCVQAFTDYLQNGPFGAHFI